MEAFHNYPHLLLPIVNDPAGMSRNFIPMLLVNLFGGDGSLGLASIVASGLDLVGSCRKSIIAPAATATAKAIRTTIKAS